MSKPSRIGFGIAASMSLISLVAACGSSGSKPSSSATSRPAAASNGGSGPFNILLVTDFSGPQSFVGKVFSPMIQLACDQINQAGGVMGHQCQYANVDDKSDPADGAVALRQALAANKNVKVVSGLLSSTAGSEVPIVIGQKLLLECSSGATAFLHPVSSFGAAKASYFYTTGQPDIVLGYSLAIGAKDLGLTHPAVIATNGPDTASTLDGITAGFAGLGIKPSITLKVASGQTSYGSEVQQLVSAHPDGLILQLTDAQSLGTFMSNYVTAANSLKIPIVTDNTILQPDFYGAIKTSLSPQEMTSYIHPVQQGLPNPTSPADDPALQSLNDLFTTKNLAPVSTVANFAPTFDGWILAALAMDEAHSLDPGVFSPYLAKLAATENSTGKTVVYTYAQGVQAIAQGKDIAYWGASGPLDWNSEHVRVPGYLVQGFAVTSSGPTATPGPVITSATLGSLIK